MGSQISRFPLPKFQKSGLGPAWGLGPLGLLGLGRAWARAWAWAWAWAWAGAWAGPWAGPRAGWGRGPGAGPGAKKHVGPIEILAPEGSLLSGAYLLVTIHLNGKKLEDHDVAYQLVLDFPHQVLTKL